MALTGIDAYILGHSNAELERLEKQAAIHAVFTDQVLRQAGLCPGMAVLDVGSGVGDITFTAARIVAPGGSVRGIDLSRQAIAAATSKIAGGASIRFDELAIDDLDDETYDAIIGRFILLHCHDPAATLRLLKGRLRAGGIAAFIEMDLSTAEAVPPLPLFSTALGWIQEVYAREGFHKDMGSHLYRAFRAAGLQPELVGSVRVEGGPDAYAYDYVAETIRSLLPRIEALGIASADEVAVETLAERIRTAAVTGEHCFFYPRMVGAFARSQR